MQKMDNMQWEAVDQITAIMEEGCLPEVNWTVHRESVVVIQDGLGTLNMDDKVRERLSTGETWKQYLQYLIDRCYTLVVFNPRFAEYFELKKQEA